VLLEDNGLLIGCPGILGNSGAVYFYSQSETGIYKFQQKIVASAGYPGDKFGHLGRLAADENIMLAVTTSNIYAFAKDESYLWTEIDKTPAENVGFLDVAISGRNALVSSANKVYAFIFQDC
jgi:hypothetical protein